MMSRAILRSLGLGLCLLAGVAGCDEPPTPTPAVALWEPVDVAFAGCQGACGGGVEGLVEGARAPGTAAVGDTTYCPVSGAVFEVSAEHPHRAAAGRDLYFCCDGCASWFDEHTDEVLAARGVDPS